VVALSVPEKWHMLLVVLNPIRMKMKNACIAAFVFTNMMTT
jgi:hypothetical protein